MSLFLPRRCLNISRLELPAGLLLLTLLLVGCGSSGEPATAPSDVIVVATVESQATAPSGGKPATSPVLGATSQPVQLSPAERPTSGRWIDVDVTRYQVQLMDGSNVVRTIAPVAVGEQINTGAYLSTQTGLFHVHVKNETLAFDAPYNTYISHWVGFDAAKDNGFHSFLKDQSGKVVDAATGKISNGCIRTGEAEAIFAFAEVGMPVYVHL